MNFRLVVALLASVSLVSAAAGPGRSDGPILPTHLVPLSEVKTVLRHEDDVETMRWLFGRYLVPYTPHSSFFFTYAIENGRLESFRFLLSRLAPSDQQEDILTKLLKEALRFGRINMARIIMEHGFQVQRYTPFWMPRGVGPWNLPQLMLFITDHAGQAAALTPHPYDFSLARSADDVDALVGLTHHCDSITHQNSLDANEALLCVIENGFLEDDEMAKAAHRLLVEGADATSERLLHALARGHPNHAKTMKLLVEWVSEDLKDEGAHMQQR